MSVLGNALCSPTPSGDKGKERGILEPTHSTRFLNMVDLACVVFLV